MYREVAIPRAERQHRYAQQKLHYRAYQIITLGHCMVRSHAKLTFFMRSTNLNTSSPAHNVRQRGDPLCDQRSCLDVVERYLPRMAEPLLGYWHVSLEDLVWFCTSFALLFSIWMSFTRF